ncbi:MAG: hypothetical protein AAF721_33555, partial [Myxococcota bacterium]
MNPYASIAYAAALSVAPLTAGASPIRTGGPAEGSAAYHQPRANDGPVGLTKFSVRSLGTEQAIAQLGVALGVGHVAGWFAGAANSAVDLDFVHNALPAGSVVKTARRAQCTNRCNVGIVAPKKGSVVVLTGFVFDTKDGAAVPVQEIAVEPDPARGIVRFTMAGQGDIDFDALLQYAVVPAAGVAGRKAVTKSKTSPNGQRRTKLLFPEFSSAAGAPLLSGFSLEFSAGSNNLHTLAISLIRD